MVDETSAVVLSPNRISRRALWVAVIATAIALPVIVFDVSNSGQDDGVTTTVPAVLAVDTPLGDRPPTGARKGVSVVIPSTTSSTLPITTSTTTTTTP